MADQLPPLEIKCFIANAEVSDCKTYKLFSKPLLGPQLLTFYDSLIETAQPSSLRLVIKLVESTAVYGVVH